MSTKDDTKTVSIKEIESKREELVQNNKALAERIQLLNQEHTNLTNQIHMTNGALIVIKMLLDEKSQTNEE